MSLAGEQRHNVRYFANKFAKIVAKLFNSNIQQLKIVINCNIRMDSQSTDSVVLRMKILFIDDDRMVLEVVGQMLADLGYNMKLISDPREAIVYSQHRCFDIDVIITDIHMPHMSGTTVVRKIREIHPDLPAIFLTGGADITAPGKLLTKPCTLGSLEKAIAEVGGRRKIGSLLKSG